MREVDPSADPSSLPFFLTAAEAAKLLRTTRAAIYMRIERGLMPGAVKDGRRVLIRRDDLLAYLEKAATA
jgi:excisionase family DNA binding protein